MNKPHSRYAHVYAVVRFNEKMARRGSEASVYVTKVFCNEEDAEREVERLNQLNAAKGGHYFCQATRLVPAT